MSRGATSFKVKMSTIHVPRLSVIVFKAAAKQKTNFSESEDIGRGYKGELYLCIYVTMQNLF